MAFSAHVVWKKKMIHIRNAVLINAIIDTIFQF